MPVSAFIGVSDAPIEPEERSISNVSGVEYANVEIQNEKPILDDIDYVSGKIVMGRQVEKQRLEISEQSGTTSNDHVLLSDSEGRLSLVSSKERNEESRAHEGRHTIETVREIEPDIRSFAIVNDTIILISGRQSGIEIAFNIFESAFQSTVDRVQFNIGEIENKLSNSGILTSRMGATYRDVDPYTTSAHIQGDLENNELENEFNQFGTPIWVQLAITHQNQDLKIGINNEGQIILYGSINLPQKVIAEILVKHSLID